ncbi:MAG: TraR/DksA C4-type zinc finger protein [Armatimonadia bacterium]
MAQRKMDMTKFKEALLAERDRLQEQLRRIDDRTAGRDRLDSMVSAEDFDEPGGDAASDTLERSQAMAIGENFRDMLAHVEHALEKMEKGTYGQCDSCGKNIAKARLEFLPWAAMCADCRKRLGS